jgi:RNA polymerase sigma factor (TIGR02999 family)
MSDVTRLLEAVAAGDRNPAADLLPLVYDERRQLAAVRMVAEAPGYSLNPTALVHEAYLRLVGDQRFDGRGHFLSAAEAMRRILVNHARDRNRQKRGGGRVRVELLDQVGSLAEDPDLVLSLANCSPDSDRKTPPRRNSRTCTCSAGFPSRTRVRRWGCRGRSPIATGSTRGVGVGREPDRTGGEFGPAAAVPEPARAALRIVCVQRRLLLVVPARV